MRSIHKHQLYRNGHSEHEFLKEFNLQQHQKNKIFRNNLSQEASDSYTENSKIQRKEIKRGLKNGNGHVHRFKNLVLVKQKQHPNWFTHGIILIKSLTAFFAKIDKLILKFICKCKEPIMAKSIFKEIKIGEIIPFGKLLIKLDGISIKSDLIINEMELGAQK